jgi:hypothetical protein
MKEFTDYKNSDRSSSPVIRSTFELNPTLKLHYWSVRMQSSLGLSAHQMLAPMENQAYRLPLSEHAKTHLVFCVVVAVVKHHASGTASDLGRAQNTTSSGAGAGGPPTSPHPMGPAMTSLPNGPDQRPGRTHGDPAENPMYRLTLIAVPLSSPTTIPR